MTQNSPGFIFGQGTDETYESLQAKRRRAEILQRRTPTRNFGEGLTALGRAAGARRLNSQAGAGEAAGQEQFQSALQKLLGSKMANLSGMTDSPYANNAQSSALAQLFKNRMGNVPGFKNGTEFAPGGRAIVGEDGPEEVILPRGSKVIPNPNTVPWAEQNANYSKQATEFENRLRSLPRDSPSRQAIMGQFDNLMTQWGAAAEQNDPALLQQGGPDPFKKFEATGEPMQFDPLPWPSNQQTPQGPAGREPIDPEVLERIQWLRGDGVGNWQDRLRQIPIDPTTPQGNPQGLNPSGLGQPGIRLPQDGRQGENRTFDDSRNFQVAQNGPVAPPSMLPKVQLELDKKYVPDFIDWTVNGGSADAQKSVAQMREALSELESGSDNLTGPIVGSVPDFIGAGLNPEAISNREAVQEIVQRNLRLILGAQFTAKEGEMLMARAYNPRLQEPENAKRVRRLLGAIESAATSKDSAAQYFKQYGTLTGWDGQLPTAASISAEVEQGDKADSAVPAGIDPDDWKYMSDEDKALFQ